MILSIRLADMGISRPYRARTASGDRLPRSIRLLSAIARHTPAKAGSAAKCCHRGEPICSPAASRAVAGISSR